MPGISRKDDDNASGTITSGSENVKVNGKSVARLGDSVAAHPPCPLVPIHCNPTLQANNNSQTVRVNGIVINVAGDTATCGHAATGSSNVFAG
jgi:uncharacterized Zn-binding protein involved in type VI secretion